MRIAIVGAHKVGKTTLAEALHESLDNYVYLQEPWHILAERGHAFSEEPAIDDFLVQLEYSIKAMATAEADIVFDRCPIDLLMYIQALGGDEEVRRLWPAVEKAVSSLDVLVYVPVEQGKVPDCPEDEFPELREEVDGLLRDMIADFEIPVLEVTGTVAQRKQQIILRVLQADTPQ